MKIHLSNIGICLLIILWIYTAGSKLADYQDFRHQLKLQHFSTQTILILQWLIPISELTAGVLLTMTRTRRIGLYLSCSLLIAFTAYVALILSGYYIKTPCSCGGVLKLMGWRAHLVFNTTFLLLNIYSIYFFHHKERRLEKNINV